MTPPPRPCLLPRLGRPGPLTPVAKLKVGRIGSALSKGTKKYIFCLILNNINTFCSESLCLWQSFLVSITKNYEENILYFCFVPKLSKWDSSWWKRWIGLCPFVWLDGVCSDQALCSALYTLILLSVKSAITFASISMSQISIFNTLNIFMSRYEFHEKCSLS